ncbi:MAG: hypothetical protein AOA65_1579 [Candidatus Bathyarchaeota archaeon BA1]|nr:MAG: hypothetical protein AOA65_1579 [Candidatus Bathyarchaeota archaeon BA1]
MCAYMQVENNVAEETITYINDIRAAKQMLVIIHLNRIFWTSSIDLRVLL